MKLLVTGGLGFIGSNFCINALRQNPEYEIINVDKIGLGANPANLHAIENEKRYEFIKGNICDPKLLSKIVKKVDAIVNIAAETHVDRSISDPYTFLQNNTVGTYTLLEVMRKHNETARLVQVSTDEIYGDVTKGASTETDQPRPSNPYSASKAAADMLVHAYHKTYGLNVSITRCTNNYGPHQFPEKLIPKTIIRALKDMPIPIYGTGKNVREWIHVQDHCEAIDTVLQKGTPGEIYNVSSGNGISNIEVATKILGQLDKPQKLITYVEDRPGHDTRYSLNASKIKTNLNWKPKIPFAKGLELAVKWYVSNEPWWKPLITEEILNPTPWKTRASDKH